MRFFQTLGMIYAKGSKRISWLAIHTDTWDMLRRARRGREPRDVGRSGNPGVRIGRPLHASLRGLDYVH
jgi:hypothetical protein